MSPQTAAEAAPHDAGERSDALRRSRGARPGHAGIPVAAAPGLARAVEDEIVPRLVRELRGDTEARHPAPTPTSVPDADVEAFVALALDRDAESASAFVVRLRARGVSLAAIYLELLQPAARRVGELWVADLRDFSDVTVAVGRMQQVLRGISDEFRGELECAPSGRRLLLAPALGEQHSFGLFIVADFFARAGWEVWGGPAEPDYVMLRQVRDVWFDVVGLSLGCGQRIDRLAEEIKALRAASRNPAVGVLVGGPAFCGRPELAVVVGADGTAADGREAVAVAEAWLAEAARRG
ncbi:MAG: cobalamin B12-binding domain-containing protein [Burkholderiales bacterium]